MCEPHSTGQPWVCLRLGLLAIYSALMPSLAWSEPVVPSTVGVSASVDPWTTQQEPVELPPMVVTGMPSPGSLIAPNIQEAKEQLLRTPTASSIHIPDDYLRTAASSVGDATYPRPLRGPAFR
ncbi:MAG: hypothetical protein ACREUD_04445 [Gammaproteobacteria bacterium]